MMKKNNNQRSAKISHGNKNDTDISYWAAWYLRGVPARLALAIGVALIGISFGLGQVANFYWLQNQHERLQQHQQEQVLALSGGSSSPITMEQSAPHDAGFVTTTIVGSVKDAGKEEKDENAEEKGSEDNDDEDAALPPGIEQQMSVDFRHVDAAFLQDEQRLAQAMIDLVSDLHQQQVGEKKPLQLTHLCRKHMNKDAGVSCSGAWRGSEDSDGYYGRISFHTSPKRGVLALDMFAVPGAGRADSSDDEEEEEELTLLEASMPLLKKLFGIPDGGEEHGNDVVSMEWKHQLRGFNTAWSENPDSAAPLAGSKDLGMEISDSTLDLKHQVATVETPFQQVDILDEINPRMQSLLGYQKSLLGEDSAAADTSSLSYEARHPDLYKPNRLVFLDGVLQSTLLGDEAYHEGLVHPGMLAHPHPKRAAIIGGGEGATLREILRHDTIEHVKMIEIDPVMVSASREYLPSWNSCADIMGSTQNCFDEPRADVRLEDALAWFMNHFGAGAGSAVEEKFDVIIMDALDPQDNVAFATALYSNDDFTESLYNALTPEGVLILQLGEVPLLNQLPDEYSKSHMRASLERDLLRFGFQSLHQYEEAACQFDAPWSYLVAFKCAKTRQNWYVNEAQVNLKIQKRLRPRVIQQSINDHSDSPLRYFDGATMAKYQVPHKAFEAVYCRSPSVSAETCEAFQGGDRSLVDFSPSAWKSLMTSNTMTEEHADADADAADVNDAKSLMTFVETFGTQNSLLGETGYDVSTSSILLPVFLSRIADGGHGKTSTTAMQHNQTDSEEHTAPDDHNKIAAMMFSPVLARHLPHLMAAGGARAGDGAFRNTHK